MYSTMSAGKSTFINALLGHDYLPSRNEACTAKVVSISDIDYIGYCLGYAVKNGIPDFCGNVDLQKVEEWNNDAEVSKIVLEGNLDRISSEKSVIVINDTPGISYSGNDEHKKIALQHIFGSNPTVIICLMDATQMFTTDFSNALDKLKKNNDNASKAHIIFVLNKADKFDSEKESLKDMIKFTMSELDKYGFKNPIIMPVSALAARLFKMALKGKTKFTQKERGDFSALMDCFIKDGENLSGLTVGFPDNTDVIKTTDISNDILSIGANTYNTLDIQKALFHTGIPVVENFLNSCTGENK
jgi:GTPase SAR1 family protein